MISEHRLKLRLYSESMRWKRELKTDFVLGIIKGLAIALSIVKEVRAK